MPPGGGGGGFDAFYWYHIFALDSAVVEVQELFSSHGGLLVVWRPSCNVSLWRNTLIKLTHYDETKIGAQDSQVVRAKENSS